MSVSDPELVMTVASGLLPLGKLSDLFDDR